MARFDYNAAPTPSITPNQLRSNQTAERKEKATVAYLEWTARVEKKEQEDRKRNMRLEQEKREKQKRELKKAEEKYEEWLQEKEGEPKYARRHRVEENRPEWSYNVARSKRDPPPLGCSSSLASPRPCQKTCPACVDFSWSFSPAGKRLPPSPPALFASHVPRCRNQLDVPPLFRDFQQMMVYRY